MIFDDVITLAFVCIVIATGCFSKKRWIKNVSLVVLFCVLYGYAFQIEPAARRINAIKQIQGAWSSDFAAGVQAMRQQTQLIRIQILVSAFGLFAMGYKWKK